ncbi:MAG: exodeoxyribonuclease VII small subunit [Collinsella sp.]|nr:exodeoxyribonuclease VII small subunit [Collinsella sp.]
MADTTVKTFDDITDRLDEIIAAVRSKDTSLEKSLDLFDEAIRLGSRAVDMVDQFDLSDREADLLETGMGAPDQADDPSSRE